MIPLNDFTHDLHIMQNLNFSSNGFKSSEKIFQKFVNKQAHKRPEKKKTIDRHDHPKQIFGRLETIDVIPNRQIFNEIALNPFNFFQLFACDYCFHLLGVFLRFLKQIDDFQF